MCVSHRVVHVVVQSGGVLCERGVDGRRAPFVARLRNTSDRLFFVVCVCVGWVESASFRLSKKPGSEGGGLGKNVEVSKCGGVLLQRQLGMYVP